MIPGFQGLPQNPSNQRPTMALFSCSRDIFDPLGLGLKACWPSDEASLPRGSESLISASCSLIPDRPTGRLTRDATRRRVAAMACREAGRGIIDRTPMNERVPAFRRVRLYPPDRMR